MSRMQLLEDAMLSVTKYTTADTYRPGLVDLFVYNAMLDLHESDYDGTEPFRLWLSTPDVIMQQIIDEEKLFTLEYGLEDLDDQILEYLDEKGFIVDPESVSDEEYTNNLEGK